MASVLDKFHNLVADNRLAALQFGAGVLGAPNLGQGLQQGLLGAMQAKQWSDQREEKKRQQEAMKQLLYRGGALGPMQDMGGGVTSQDLGAPLQPNQPNQYGLTEKDALMTQALGPQYLAAKLSQGGGQGFTLSPGQNRYDAAGNLLVKGPEKSASESKTQRDREIEDMMFNYGMNRKQATAYVDGVWTLRTNPVTGLTEKVNTVDGTSEPLSYLGGDVYSGPAETDGTQGMFSMLNDAFGFGPTFKEQWAKTGGQVTGDAAPKIQAAKQHARQIQEALIRAYTDTDRPPVMQQARILKMIPNPNTFWENPESAGYTFAQMYGEIQSDRARLMQLVNNRELPVDQRQEAVKRLTELDRAISLIGDPANFTPQASVQNATTEELLRTLYGEGK